MSKVVNSVSSEYFTPDSRSSVFIFIVFSSPTPPLPPRPLCVEGKLGRGENESGERWEGKRKQERLPPFSSSHCSPRACWHFLPKNSPNLNSLILTIFFIASVIRNLFVNPVTKGFLFFTRNFSPNAPSLLQKGPFNNLWKISAWTARGYHVNPTRSARGWRRKDIRKLLRI